MSREGRRQRLLVTLIDKEIRVEWRSRETWVTGLFFAVLLAVIFMFGFPVGDPLQGTVGPSVLWVALVFVSNLVFGRLFLAERQTGCLDALRLVPGIHGPLFWAKCIGSALVLAAMEAVLVPAVALVFQLPVLRNWPGLLLALLLGTIGLSALGTVIAASLANIRLKEVLLPLVLFPLIIPLMIAGVKATASLGWGRMELYWDWIRLMVAFDAVFVVLARWLFRRVLEAVA